MDRREEVEPLLQSGASFGFVPRLPDALEFALENRVLLVLHERTQIEADLALGLLPFEEATVQNATLRDIGGFSVALPRPEDLVVMKKSPDARATSPMSKVFSLTRPISTVKKFVTSSANSRNFWKRPKCLTTSTGFCLKLICQCLNRFCPCAICKPAFLPMMA